MSGTDNTWNDDACGVYARQFLALLDRQDAITERKWDEGYEKLDHERFLLEEDVSRLNERAMLLESLVRDAILYMTAAMGTTYSRAQLYAKLEELLDRAEALGVLEEGD